MKKILLDSYFNWKEAFVTLYFNNGRTTRVKAIKENKRTFSITVDENNIYAVKFSYLKDRTGMLFTNGLSSHYEYKKFREHKDTYVKDIYPDGKLTTYEIEDKEHLYLWGNKKKIYIYTPSNFDSSKPYGLIVSFDGQNGFVKNKFEKSTFRGGVGLDVFSEILTHDYHQNYLILGIDNGSYHRDEELIMHEEFGHVNYKALHMENFKDFRGNLDLLLEFMNEKVLPFVFSKYNIDKSRIGLYGSSLGGLACYYTVLKYPNIYSFGLPFSPAFMIFSSDDFKLHLEKCLKEGYAPKLYFFSGNVTNLEKDILKATKEVINKISEIYSKDNYALRINLTAPHNEVSWRIALNEGFKYLLIR